MINEIVRAIFKVVLLILRWFFNILSLPLLPLINSLPLFQNYLNIAYNFIDNYLFKPIAFGREVFLNLTGFPQEIISISVTLALLIMTFIIALRSISFFLNLWRMFKGGE